MTKRVLALGEVLWDVVDGVEHFGGAPANFACAVAQLGQSHVHVQLASAVGNDSRGHAARQHLMDRGVDGSLIETVPYATGVVHVQLDDHGHASYDITSDVAWDHIPLSRSLREAAAHADLIYFGTLMQRDPASDFTLLGMLSETDPSAIRLLDLNLRAPHWNWVKVESSLRLAHVVKLNEEELGLLARYFNWSGTVPEQLQQLQQKHGLRLVALTCGADGSWLCNDHGQCQLLPNDPVQLHDTIGAGDAFSAALALGLLAGLPLPKLHAWANTVAGYVCTQPGGTPTFPKHLHLSENHS